MDPPEYQGTKRSAWIRWLWQYDRRQFKKYIRKSKIKELDRLVNGADHQLRRSYGDVVGFAYDRIEYGLIHGNDYASERELDLFEEDYASVSGKR